MKCLLVAYVTPFTTLNQLDKRSGTPVCGWGGWSLSSFGDLVWWYKGFYELVELIQSAQLGFFPVKNRRLWYEICRCGKADTQADFSTCVVFCFMFYCLCCEKNMGSFIPNLGWWVQSFSFCYAWKTNTTNKSFFVDFQRLTMLVRSLPRASTLIGNGGNGGLEHFSFFHIGKSNPDWLWYFSEG